MLSRFNIYDLLFYLGLCSPLWVYLVYYFSKFFTTFSVYMFMKTGGVLKYMLKCLINMLKYCVFYFVCMMFLADIRGIIGGNEIKRYIELVGLDSESKKKVGKFSVGMKQRLAFAQAIMESSQLLLLDEPFSGLDEEGVELVRNLIIQLNRKDGVTVLITSHIKEDIEMPMMSGM